MQSSRARAAASHAAAMPPSEAQLVQRQTVGTAAAAVPAENTAATVRQGDNAADTGLSAAEVQTGGGMSAEAGAAVEDSGVPHASPSAVSRRPRSGRRVARHVGSTPDRR